MACRGCLECLLKLLNFLLAVSGLAIVGYGVYLLVVWKRTSDVDTISPSVATDLEFITLGRPMMFAASLSASILDKLPRAWSWVTCVHWSFVSYFHGSMAQHLPTNAGIPSVDCR
ncbi:hypothetical protein ACLOJK_033821 [Asimina triloba]